MNKPMRIEAETADVPWFTARDYTAMLERGGALDFRVELVAGALHKMMPSYLAHGEMNVTLTVLLHTAFADTPLRTAIDLAIGIDDTTIRAPDFVVIDSDAPFGKIVPAHHVRLVVEIADSSLGTDLGDKAADYARAEVPDYWVVDVVARAVHIMSEPEEGAYGARHIVPFGTPTPVPGAGKAITIP